MPMVFTFEIVGMVIQQTIGVQVSLKLVVREWHCRGLLLGGIVCGTIDRSAEHRNTCCSTRDSMPATCSYISMFLLVKARKLVLCILWYNGKVGLL